MKGAVSVPMKAFSILGIIAALATAFFGWVTFSLEYACFCTSGMDVIHPKDAKLSGLVLMGCGLFFLVFSIVSLRRK